MAEKSPQVSWIRFLRQYGPIPRNDNMYDETIQRAAARAGVPPIVFEHPFHASVLGCYANGDSASSVILTGTAGDGKTHLCRQVWAVLGGNQEAWASNNPYLTLSWAAPGGARTYKVHVIRDLSAWAPQQGLEWDAEKVAVLQAFCRTIFESDPTEIFLIAANDGQLVESLRRLPTTDHVARARALMEDLLVNDKQEEVGVRLKLFNLSRGSSAILLDRALDSFINHPGWKSCLGSGAPDDEPFGKGCPIRRNYELLQDAVVRSRLRALFELCDYNGLHIPLRQTLLLLTNAVLGHPDARDHLMTLPDAKRIISEGTASKASLFNNIFGGNLPDIRRSSITIFDYLERFQVGHETTNRIDNILIFGQDDVNLRPYFDRFVAGDTFYGADKHYYAAKQEYIEGNEDPEKLKSFLPLLVSQRRGLFFKIPDESDGDLKLWELTVFKFAGEFLRKVVGVLKDGRPVDRPLLWRLVKGLNRIFTGMLISADRDIHLATSGNYSQAKVSRISIDKISLEPSKGESVTLQFDASRAKLFLKVQLSPEIVESLELNLVRYEFLSRVALDGALPSSFSKECYEDVLAFKSRLLMAHERRQPPGPGGPRLDLKLLSLSDNGTPEERFVEVIL